VKSTVFSLCLLGGEYDINIAKDLKDPPSLQHAIEVTKILYVCMSNRSKYHFFVAVESYPKPEDILNTVYMRLFSKEYILFLVTLHISDMHFDPKIECFGYKRVTL